MYNYEHNNNTAPSDMSLKMTSFTGIFVTRDLFVRGQGAGAHVPAGVAARRGAGAAGGRRPQRRAHGAAVLLPLPLARAALHANVETVSRSTVETSAGR